MHKLGQNPTYLLVLQGKKYTLMRERLYDSKFRQGEKCSCLSDGSHTLEDVSFWLR